jgi:hypothetical protein
MHLLRIGAAAAFLVAAVAHANPAARWRVVSPPDCPGAGHILAEDAIAPTNATFMRVQHIGDPGTAELAGEVANPVTWDVGALTGFHAEARTQRGYRDVALPVGASAFQLDCVGAGFLINTWQFGHNWPLRGEGPSATIGRDLDPAPRIFANARAMILEARIAVPWAYTESPPVVEGTAQVSFLYYAYDRTHGNYVAHVIALFDNRPAGLAGDELVASDGVTAFASSPLDDRGASGGAVRYVSVVPGSETMRFAAPFADARTFRAMVTVESFRALLERIQATMMPRLSTNPADYEIVFFGVLGEVFPGTGDDHNVSLGASVRDLALHADPWLSARGNRQGGEGSNPR